MLCSPAYCRICNQHSRTLHPLYFAVIGTLPRTYSTGGEEQQGLNLRKRVAAAYAKRLQFALEQINKANKKYENFVGLSDVQEAQRKVKEAEETFLEVRARERAIMREMISTREKLKHVRERLSHVDYSNPMYLQLASEQHALVTDEDKQKTELEEAEDDERDTFSTLSNAMRESYEQERARVERTKNWSIIGTMIGTIIGMVGSIYMNRVRTKNLIKTVQEASDMTDVSSRIELLASKTEEKQTAIATAINSLSDHVSNMSDALRVQNMEVLSGFVNDSLRDGAAARVDSNQGPSNGQKPVSSDSTLQVLSEEIDQYNKALLSLSNAVMALSKTQTGGSVSNGGKVEEHLGKLLNSSINANSKLDDIISSANKSNVGGISNRLKAIENYLERLTISSPISVPVISEVHVDEPSSNWKTGLKDMALWGFILYSVYTIISV